MGNITLREPDNFIYMSARPLGALEQANVIEGISRLFRKTSAATEEIWNRKIDNYEGHSPGNPELAVPKD